MTHRANGIEPGNHDIIYIYSIYYIHACKNSTRQQLVSNVAPPQHNNKNIIIIIIGKCNRDDKNEYLSCFFSWIAAYLMILLQMLHKENELAAPADQEIRDLVDKCQQFEMGYMEFNGFGKRSLSHFELMSIILKHLEILSK